MAVSLRVLQASYSIPSSASTSSPIRRSNVNFSCRAAAGSPDPFRISSRIYTPNDYHTVAGSSPGRVLDIYESPKLMAHPNPERWAKSHCNPSTPPPDMESLLLSKRIVNLSLPLVSIVGELIISQLIYLDWQSTTEPITLLINSTGTTRDDDEVIASATEGFAIYDILMSMKYPITTIAIGTAMGQAALLLAAGTKGRRFMFPHTQITINHPRVPPSGLMPADDVGIYVKQAVRLRDLYIKLMSHHTGTPVETITKAIRGTLDLGPVEAIKFGVVDKVLWRGNERLMKELTPPEEWDKLIPPGLDIKDDPDYKFMTF